MFIAEKHKRLKIIIPKRCDFDVSQNISLFFDIKACISNKSNGINQYYYQ